MKTGTKSENMLTMYRLNKEIKDTLSISFSYFMMLYQLMRIWRVNWDMTG